LPWHDIRDPQDPELDRLAALYHLHPLHIEDCRHRNQSAKVEEHNGYLFVVLKPLVLTPDGALDICDLDIFLGPDFLITVQEDGGCKTGPLIDQIRENWGSLRLDQVLYRIADGIVDSYLPCLDAFNDTIDELEDRVLEHPSPQALAKIFETKRALIQLRRVLVNTRDVAGHLQRIECDLIGRDVWPFLRDVYDHVARNLDLLETQRDLLNGTLDIYLSSVANRTNQVMKVLTVLGTVALPAVIISSLYGMNIEGLPWRNSPHALAIVGGLIAAITVVLLAVLRVFRWF
jgi:magnesium transporter